MLHVQKGTAPKHTRGATPQKARLCLSREYMFATLEDPNVSTQSILFITLESAFTIIVGLVVVCRNIHGCD